MKAGTLGVSVPVLYDQWTGSFGGIFSVRSAACGNLHDCRDDVTTIYDATLFLSLAVHTVLRVVLIRLDIAWNVRTTPLEMHVHTTRMTKEWLGVFQTASNGDWNVETLAGVVADRSRRCHRTLSAHSRAGLKWPG